MAGLDETGLTIRTQPELQELMEDALAAALPGVNVRAGFEHQLVGIFSEKLAECWEALQAVYSSNYPESADGLVLDQVAAITGTVRREATKSTVVATVTLNAGVTLPAGSIAAVDGAPDAQFVSTEDVTNGGGSPADVEVTFEAVEGGPVAAPAGTLTVIVEPVTGWNSITNADDAELGRDIAEDPELRDARIIELAGGGAGTVASIRAAVARIDEVIEVFVKENVTMTTDGEGRPAKSVEAIVWDGSPPAADDDEIAQAIFDHKPAGIEAHGTGSSGTAVDDTGAENTVEFTRATALQVYVDAEVILKPGTAAGWEDQAKQAISARGDEYTVGEDSYVSQLICALLEVPGIVAVPTLTMDTVSPPVDPSVVTTFGQIIRIAIADITVAEA